MTPSPQVGAEAGDGDAGADAAPAAAAAEGPGPWATADELAQRHAVSRRTVFRWLSAGQVVSREEAGITQYRVVGARAPTHGPANPPPRSPRGGLASAASERLDGGEGARASAPERLEEVVEDLAQRLGRVEAQLDEEATAHEADVRGSARELEQARLLTELAQRHAERSRADLDEVKARLADALRALDVERERAYRLALVATLPFWQFAARREMLAEIAAMKALPAPEAHEPRAFEAISASEALERRRGR